jgi:mono/diheme cytochrome c family protein
MSENIDYARTANVARLHSAAAREQGQPQVKQSPISLWMLPVLGAVFMSAGTFFGGNIGSTWSAAMLGSYDDKLTPPEDAGGGAAAPMSDEELRSPENWLAAGKAVYGNNCASCHQPTGLGAPGQYPPLKGAEFVINGERRLTAILLHGISGKLTVDGKDYNGQMQPLGYAMTDKQLGQLLSYVRNEWGNKGSLLYDDQIKALRKELGSRPAYNETELRAIDANASAPASEWPAKIAAKGAGASAPAPTAPAATPKS